MSATFARKIPTRNAVLVGLGTLLAVSPVIAIMYGVHGFGAVNYAVCVGFSAFFTAFLLSAVHGIVNWDSERARLLAAAFAWGAGIATMAAVFIETQLGSAGFAVVSNHTGVTVVAPIVEEILKGLGVVAILLATRGRANAFLLALVVGLGFATYENAQYLAQNLAQNGYGHEFFSFVISRGLDGTFIHAGCTGMLGLALQVARGRRLLWAIPVTLTAGVLTHAICNGAFGLVQNALVETVVIVSITAALVLLQRRLTRVSGGQDAPATVALSQNAGRL